MIFLERRSSPHEPSALMTRITLMKLVHHSLLKDTRYWLQVGGHSADCRQLHSCQRNFPTVNDGRHRAGKSRGAPEAPDAQTWPKAVVMEWAVRVVKAKQEAVHLLVLYHAPFVPKPAQGTGTCHVHIQLLRIRLRRKSQHLEQSTQSVHMEM